MATGGDRVVDNNVARDRDGAPVGTARSGGVRNGRRRARQTRTRRVFGHLASALLALIGAVLSGAFLVVMAAYYTGGPFGIGAVAAGLGAGIVLVGLWVWRRGWPIRVRRTRGDTPR